MLKKKKIRCKENEKYSYRPKKQNYDPNIGVGEQK